MKENPQKYYPINLDIRDRDCLVVGGGAVGARKVGTLLDCGARMTVISIRTDAEIDRRRADWRAPEPTITHGYMARYAKLVSSAAQGAIVE